MTSTATERPATASAIPDTMRALRKMSAAPGFTLQQIPVPAIGPNDVLIRVEDGRASAAPTCTFTAGITGRSGA